MSNKITKPLSAEVELKLSIRASALEVALREGSLSLENVHGLDREARLLLHALLLKSVNI